MSPRSENGGGDSGGDSSGNESPALDQDAAGTPDPRGRQTHIQLCGELAPCQIRTHRPVPLLLKERGVRLANEEML